MCVYMTLNTEEELWEEDRIMECTRDEQEDYLGKSGGGSQQEWREMWEGTGKRLALFNVSNDVV